MLILIKLVQFCYFLPQNHKGGKLLHHGIEMLTCQYETACKVCKYYILHSLICYCRNSRTKSSWFSLRSSYLGYCTLSRAKEKRGEKCLLPPEHYFRDSTQEDGKAKIFILNILKFVSQQLALWGTVFLEKLTVTQLIKNFSSFYDLNVHRLHKSPPLVPILK
jgi:hypothetical protein